jgi:hypothetical protein
MMPVVAWTPNNRSEVVPLIEMGVDGFITNEPGNVLGYVADFIAGKLPASDSDDKFSVSDLVWVALGSAGISPCVWWCVVCVVRVVCRVCRACRMSSCGLKMALARGRRCGRGFGRRGCGRVGLLPIEGAPLHHHQRPYGLR